MAQHTRGYLIYDDVQEDPSLRPIFDAAVDSVLKDSAQKTKGKGEVGYASPDCLHAAGHDILHYDVLKYYLHEQAVKGFVYEEARDFTERMRKLLGWQPLSYPLQSWFERCVRDPNFINLTPEVHFESKQEWIVNPQADTEHISADVFEYACYIALCALKFGPSYASVTAERIFHYVNLLGSDLPKKLKKQGSGDLPSALALYKEGEVTCKANDAFATISVTIKQDGEKQYSQVLDYLCRLLESDFPRSYSLSFRCPEKHFLEIKGLPKKGVHLLFAGAARYPDLYPQIETYARLATKEYEWYNDLDAEDCAMPGTFAVFALGLASQDYTPLVIDYLNLCDAEHQSIQARFIKAYVARYGLGERGLQVFLAGVMSIQELSPEKIYREAVAQKDVLEQLLAAKSNYDEYDWQRILYALWGDDAINNKGAKTLKAAREDLKPICRKLLCSENNE